MTVVDPADLAPQDRYGLMVNTVMLRHRGGRNSFQIRTAESCPVLLFQCRHQHPLHGDDQPGPS